MRFSTTFACAAFAVNAIAWEHPTEEHHEFPGHESIHAREAEDEWEHAHGGKAPAYNGFEGHEHFARSAHFHSGPGPKHARSLPHFDEPNVDTSLEGYDHDAAQAYMESIGVHDHHARSAEPIHHDGIFVPGHERRSNDKESLHVILGHHAREAKPIHHDGVFIPEHHRRSNDKEDIDPVYGHSHHYRAVDEEGDIDYSLDGYDHDLVARAAAESKTWAPKDWKEQAWSEHLSYLSHPHSHTGTESDWPHPTKVAHDLKEGWEHLTKGADNKATKAWGGLESKGKSVGEEIKSFFARGMPYEDARHHNEPGHEAEHGHMARGMPYEDLGHFDKEPKLHRPHQAREAVTAHEPVPEAELTKHTASKTVHPSKSTGGWGFPW